VSGSIHHQANLVLRFVLELCALAALFYWGWWSGEGTFAGLALGLGAVLLAAVFWGLFAAPTPAYPCRWPDGSRSSWRSSGRPPLGFTPPDIPRSPYCCSGWPSVIGP